MAGSWCYIYIYIYTHTHISLLFICRNSQPPAVGIHLYKDSRRSSETHILSYSFRIVSIDTPHVCLASDMALGVAPGRQVIMACGGQTTAGMETVASWSR